MKTKLIGKQIKRTKSELEREIEGLVGEQRFEAWKKFAFKGEMLQMAIAFVLGAAFQKVVTGLSNHCIMPILNWMLEFTGTDWRDHTYTFTEGLTIETGQLAGSFVDFLLISIILFTVYKRVLFILKEPEKPKITCIETKVCHSCQTDIHYLATRCPYCTSWTIDSDKRN